MKKYLIIIVLILAIAGCSKYDADLEQTGWDTIKVNLIAKDNAPAILKKKITINNSQGKQLIISEDFGVIYFPDMLTKIKEKISVNIEMETNDGKVVKLRKYFNSSPKQITEINNQLYYEVNSRIADNKYILNPMFSVETAIQRLHWGEKDKWDTLGTPTQNTLILRNKDKKELMFNISSGTGSIFINGVTGGEEFSNSMISEIEKYGNTTIEYRLDLLGQKSIFKKVDVKSIGEYENLSKKYAEKTLEQLLIKAEGGQFKKVTVTSWNKVYDGYVIIADFEFRGANNILNNYLCTGQINVNEENKTVEFYMMSQNDIFKMNNILRKNLKKEIIGNFSFTF